MVKTMLKLTMREWSSYSNEERKSSFGCLVDGALKYYPKGLD